MIARNPCRALRTSPQSWWSFRSVSVGVCAFRVPCCRQMGHRGGRASTTQATGCTAASRLGPVAPACHPVPAPGSSVPATSDGGRSIWSSHRCVMMAVVLLRTPRRVSEDTIIGGGRRLAQQLLLSSSAASDFFSCVVVPLLSVLFLLVPQPCSWSGDFRVMPTRNRKCSKVLADTTDG